MARPRKYLDEKTKKRAIKALYKHSGNIFRAGKEIGLDRMTFRRKIQEDEVLRAHLAEAIESSDEEVTSYIYDMATGMDEANSATIQACSVFLKRQKAVLPPPIEKKSPARNSKARALAQSIIGDIIGGKKT